MSERSSIRSFAESDEGSLRRSPPPSSRASEGTMTEDDPPSQMISIGAMQGESAHGSSVSSATLRDLKDDDESVNPFKGRSFDQYDEESDHLDDDIDAPLTPAEQELMREIEREQRADDELERDPTTRAALLMSPLLMAASSEVLTSADSDGSLHQVQIIVNPTPEPARDNGIRKPDDAVTDEYDSDLDGEINEDDLNFGERHAVKEPEESAPEVDPFIQPNSQPNADTEERARNRWQLIIAFWVVAIAVACTMIGVLVSRSNRSRRAPAQPSTLRPTKSPTVSPMPTTTPQPTRLFTDDPTMTPSMILRTRSPSIEPMPATEAPIASPILGTTNPETSQPSLQTTSPLPFSEPTIEPSFTDEETARRADITSLIVSVSGVLVLYDPRSPQNRAWQWIMNDDPLGLLASEMPQILQRYTLATLYYSTDGDNNWATCGPPIGSTPCSNVLRRFLSGSPECTWFGITCNREGDIEIINIRENGLAGPLPPELGELSRLSTLSLGGNSLTGNIPTKLTFLTRLSFFLLNGNDYAGKIPTLFGDLPSLAYLHLGNNAFSGTIPSEIFSSSLQHFDVGGNRLIGTIPPELYTVSENLLNIDLSDNALTGTIPSGLGDFPSLNSFTANNNTLSGTLPGELISDTLATLDVGSNTLRGELPPDIYMFGSSLTFLNLGMNSFEGTISTSFGDLVDLQTLVFFFNEFTGTVPNSLSSLTNLEVLHFAGTKLEGTMPLSVCALRSGNLQTLTASCDGPDQSFACSCCTFCFAG